MPGQHRAIKKAESLGNRSERKIMKEGKNSISGIQEVVGAGDGDRQIRKLKPGMSHLCSWNDSLGALHVTKILTPHLLNKYSVLGLAGTGVSCPNPYHRQNQSHHQRLS